MGLNVKQWILEREIADEEGDVRKDSKNRKLWYESLNEFAEKNIFRPFVAYL